VLNYVAQRTDIQEIILSGGDPLSLSDKRLSQLVDSIEQIPHITRLRIHTRLPVVIPSRITPALVDTLLNTRLAVVVVVHINHPQEIDSSLSTAMGQLRATGATLLNQAVLLAGINDSTEILAELSEKLFKSGVLPYYLHLLDAVQGAAHFAVGATKARQLMAALRNQLPGYCVPKLVQENPGTQSKTPL
jgi:EF-P beta-lysylation protein EpmB